MQQNFSCKTVDAICRDVSTTARLPWRSARLSDVLLGTDCYHHLNVTKALYHSGLRPVGFDLERRGIGETAPSFKRAVPEIVVRLDLSLGRMRTRILSESQ
jgi:hypothetical protein